MVKGTHICAEETGTLFNLETKRLNMGWTEIAFNEINFVERGQRHLCVSSSIVEIDGVRVKFSFKETSKRRRRLDIIHTFIRGNVLGGLDLACLKIFAICMSHGLLVSWEDPRTSIHINLGISRFGGKGADVTTKDAKKREIGVMTSTQI